MSDIENEPKELENNPSVFTNEETEEGFLPEVDENDLTLETQDENISVEGTELDNFESAEIDEVEFIEDARVKSIIESILFASDRPVSLAAIKGVFKGTQVKSDKIRKTLEQLAIDYAGGEHGITLEDVPGGYQLRTKIDNLNFIKRNLQARAFKVSGPAMEVLSIVAYKQPLIKSEIDEIRGVESGHLLRALMERGLVNFAGKSDLPGRPMYYETTKRFLEIFSLRSIKELPTLSQIDELIPEGIGDEEDAKKETLSSVTDSMSQTMVSTYSEGEDELLKIQDQLSTISTTSDFFEKEKKRMKDKQDAEKAQNIREALTLGEPVSTRDQNWLNKYDLSLSIQNHDAEHVAQDAQSVESKIATEEDVSQTENIEEPEEHSEELFGHDEESEH